MTKESTALPFDLDAERATLAACIVDPNAFGRVVDFLLPQHFYTNSHNTIWGALTALWTSKVPIDVVTLASHLKSRSEVNLVGGMGYLTEVLGCSPAATNVRAHAIIVHDAWRKRSAYRLFAAAAAKIETGGVEAVDEFLDAAIAAATKLSHDRPDRPVVTNGALCERYLRQVCDGANRAASGVLPRAIPTGIECFDNHTGGLILGQKTTVVALARVGKTHFAVQAAINAAKLGFGVLIYSTELGDEEFAGREIAHVARINSQRLEMTRAGVPQLMPAEMDRMVASHTEYRKLPILVDDRSDVTIDQITAEVRQWVERFHVTFGAPLGLVIIDYIQRLTPPSYLLKHEKNKQVSYATTRFTKLLKETKLAGLELAQQATPTRGAANAKPDLYDVADDKTIVKEAQSVAYLYRPFANSDTRVNLLLAKLRGGKEAEWALELDGSQSRFTEVDD